MGQPIRQAEGIKMRSVEAAYAAVGCADPEEAVAVLVDGFHVHPSQPVEDCVLLPEDVTECLLLAWGRVVHR